MVDVFGRAKHFEIQTGAPLAPNVDRVALIKIDSPRSCFRFPAQTIELHRELGCCTLWIVATQALNRSAVAICDCHNARLLWLQINLKSKFVILVVAIEIIRLRWQLDRLQNARVFFERSGVARRDDRVTRFEIRRDAFQVGNADDDIFGRPRFISRIGDAQFEDF